MSAWEAAARVVAWLPAVCAPYLLWRLWREPLPVLPRRWRRRHWRSAERYLRDAATARAVRDGMDEAAGHVLPEEEGP